MIGGDKLAAGQDNPVKVIYTAEDGSKKEYIIVDKYVAAHDGSVDAKPIKSMETTSLEVLTGRKTKMAVHRFG